jgi:hypothetical protein
MFLNSSKSIKSKIIQAAIQVDAEYRMYRGNIQGDNILDREIRIATMIEEQPKIEAKDRAATIGS